MKRSIFSRTRFHSAGIITHPEECLRFVFGIWILSSGFCHAILDTNNNGISDFWELHFNNGSLFDESFAPQADSDADGWTNAQEAVAGTDPFDANPPVGLIRPAIANIPTVFGEPDENGVPTVTTPEAVTVTWPTIKGKSYSLLFSPDLTPGSWLAVGDAFVGNGNAVEYGFLTGSAERCFWRVTVADADTDTDGLTDAEEHESGTNPALADSDGDGLPDAWEILHGFDPLSTGDQDADPDNDFFSNAEEYAAGLDPMDPANGQTAAVTSAPQAPGRPHIDLSADVATAGIIWEDRSDNELLFQIERSEDGGPWQRIATLPANTTTYTDSGLNPTVIYFYRIVSRNNFPE